MNIQQVNDILTLDKQLDEEDEKKLNKMDVDLNISKKDRMLNVASVKKECYDIDTRGPKGPERQVLPSDEQVD